MSSNFNYSFQRGTESLPTEPNQRLGGIRQSGNEPNDEFTQEIMERNSALIDDFIRQSCQEADISGLDIYFNLGQYPEFDITYIRQFGKENINVSPKVQRPKKEDKEEFKIIEDIMLDGYIGVIYNAVDQIDSPQSMETNHKVGFNKVWVYIPNYTPPGGYPPNFNLYYAVPSYDGTTYGIMDFNTWYPLAKTEWVVYDASVSGNHLRWVGPEEERYVHNLDNFNLPLVTSPLNGETYIIAINISIDIELQYWYKLTTGIEPIPAIGPEFHNKVPIQITLNGTTLLNYTSTKMETKCFIFRFGKDACRSHSYRDQITKDFGLKLLNKIIPLRPDPDKKFKQLLPANCGLDPDFWHGTFQVYDNYKGTGIVPVEVVDMGVFSLELINTGINRVTASYGNPPQTTTYFDPGLSIANTEDRFFESLDSVGQISMFAEFFSRNPKDFRLVDQSWHNGRKEGIRYRVNDLPKYFFCNANIYNLLASNSEITEFVEHGSINIGFTSNVSFTAQPNILSGERYLFNQKVPFSINIYPTTVQDPKTVYADYSDFSFEFDLSTDAKDKIPATQNLPDVYNYSTIINTVLTRRDLIRQPYPIWVQQVVRKLNNNLPEPFPPGALHGFSLFGEMFDNVWHEPSEPINITIGKTNYWYEPEVENGISDWLLFVRSLMPPYIINGDTSITKPQAEEAFVKEGN